MLEEAVGVTSMQTLKPVEAKVGLVKYEHDPLYSLVVEKMEELMSSKMMFQRESGGFHKMMRDQNALITELSAMTWSDKTIGGVDEIWQDVFKRIGSYFGEGEAESWRDGIMGEVAARVLIAKSSRYLEDSEGVHLPSQDPELDKKGVDISKDLTLVDERNKEKVKIYIQVKTSKLLAAEEIRTVDMDSPNDADIYDMEHVLHMGKWRGLVDRIDEDFGQNGRDYSDRVPLLLVLGTRGGWQELMRFVLSADNQISFASDLDDLLEKRNEREHEL